MIKMNYNDILMSYYEQPYLSHHGILGQKWGVRRFQNKDGSLTAAGKKRYDTGIERKDANSTRNEDHHAKDSNKSAAWLAAKLALDIATIPINPANAIYLAQDAKRLGDAFGSKAKSNLYESERQNEKVDPKTGFHLKSKDLSPEEDLKRVNPEFKDFNTNTKSNCMLCTMTYDLRRRGFDVTAQKASVGYSYETVNEFYPKAKLEHVGNTLFKDSSGNRMTRRDLHQNTIDALSKQGDGARGNLMVQWNMGGAHSMAYEVRNGQVHIFDGQNGKVTKNPNKILNNCYDVTYARLDNVEPDYKKMKEVCR